MKNKKVNKDKEEGFRIILSFLMMLIAVIAMVQGDTIASGIFWLNTILFRYLK